MTACFGGVLRDILCNEIPVVFREEIYATICILGGIVFFMLKKWNIEDDVLYLITSLVIIIVRILAKRYNWHLSPIEHEK
jgi:uncharacterized membrane protein YeiH